MLIIGEEDAIEESQGCLEERHLELEESVARWSPMHTSQIRNRHHVPLVRNVKSCMHCR